MITLTAEPAVASASLNPPIHQQLTSPRNPITTVIPTAQSKANLFNLYFCNKASNTAQP